MWSDSKPFSGGNIGYFELIAFINWALSSSYLLFYSAISIYDLVGLVHNPTLIFYLTFWESTMWSWWVWGSLGCPNNDDYEILPFEIFPCICSVEIYLLDVAGILLLSAKWTYLLVVVGVTKFVDAWFCICYIYLK